MTEAELRALQPGDIIRHKGSFQAVIVAANYGSRVTAVRVFDVTNAIEWDLIQKAASERGQGG